MDVKSLTPSEKSHENINIERSFDDADSDVEVLDPVAIMDKKIQNPFVPSARYLGSFLVQITEDDSEQVVESAPAIKFRRSLMIVLTKPFDQDEYARLSKLFEDGKYHRYNPDVAEKLNEYGYEKEKCLNILRGFFFWLQNLTQDGAFEPWSDRECLAARA